MTMTKPINEKPEVHYFSGAAKSINFLDRNASASIEAKRVQSFKSFVVTIDLHMHSNASDGILPPAEVVRLCAGNGWFNPKNPDCIALVTPFFLAASLCLEETDCYAIVPKATAELALEAMLQLSDAAPKLTVRLGWHERTHADPGSQLIRAQLLALIQKRFGRPVGE